jgi:hypothetical protein
MIVCAGGVSDAVGVGGITGAVGVSGAAGVADSPPQPSHSAPNARTSAASSVTVVAPVNTWRTPAFTVSAGGISSKDASKTTTIIIPLIMHWVIMVSPAVILPLSAS